MVKKINGFAEDLNCTNLGNIDVNVPAEIEQKFIFMATELYKSNPNKILSEFITIFNNSKNLSSIDTKIQNIIDSGQKAGMIIAQISEAVITHLEKTRNSIWGNDRTEERKNFLLKAALLDTQLVAPDRLEEKTKEINELMEPKPKEKAKTTHFKPSEPSKPIEPINKGNDDSENSNENNDKNDVAMRHLKK